MQTVRMIKSRIGQSGAEKLSDFLKIPSPGVVDALGEAMNTMLGGLINITQTEGSAARILKVINDGGHSGDLVEDLDTLFANKDKLQLLITIGQNINNHFFHSKSSQMVDALAHVSGTDRNTANSLLSLSAPLVLGALGRAVRTDNLSASEFTDRILSETEGYTPRERPSVPVMAATSIPAPEFQEPPRPVQTEAVFQEKSKKKQTNYNWLAWLLLAVLGMAALYFGFKDKLTAGVQNISDSEQAKDSSEYVAPGDVMDNFSTETGASSETGSAALKEDKPAEVHTVPKVAETQKQAKTFTSPEPASGRTKSRQEGTSSFRKIRQEALEMENAEVLPSGAVFLGPQEEEYTVETSTDSRSMNAKLGEAGAYFSINGLGFKSSSAEIMSKGELNTLISYLKENPAAKIEIAGKGSGRKADDRAYALRDQLFQSGISINRMKIVNGVSKSDGPVFVKII